jgi:hypothetical protein
MQRHEIRAVNGLSLESHAARCAQLFGVPAHVVLRAQYVTYVPYNNRLKEGILFLTMTHSNFGLACLLVGNYFPCMSFRSFWMKRFPRKNNSTWISRRRCVNGFLNGTWRLRKLRSEKSGRDWHKCWAGMWTTLTRNKYGRCKTGIRRLWLQAENSSLLQITAQSTGPYSSITCTAGHYNKKFT